MPGKIHFFIVVQEEGNYLSHCVPHYTWLESLPHSSAKYFNTYHLLKRAEQAMWIVWYWNNYQALLYNFFSHKGNIFFIFSLSSANAVVTKSHVNQYWKYFLEEHRNHTQALILMKNKNRTCQTKQFEI